jgi:hypothetical protein
MNRADGMLPDTLLVQPEALAAGLPVFEDVDGYKWIRVGPDTYMPLSGQLLRAVLSQYPAVSLAAASEVGGELIPLVPERER